MSPARPIAITTKRAPVRIQNGGHEPSASTVFAPRGHDAQPRHDDVARDAEASPNPPTRTRARIVRRPTLFPAVAHARSCSVQAQFRSDASDGLRVAELLPLEGSRQRRVGPVRSRDVIGRTWVRVV